VSVDLKKFLAKRISLHSKQMFERRSGVEDRRQVHIEVVNDRRSGAADRRKKKSA